jgi:2-hydroxychromene-2-carboxylate isomerase
MPPRAQHMSVRHEPGRVVIVLTRSHLKVAAIIFAGVVLGILMFFTLKSSLPGWARRNAAESTPDSVAWLEAPLFDVATSSRPMLGTSDALVTIVEFTDYGCSVCRRHAAEVLPALLGRFETSIKYVVRHFPIPALTANAMAAAIASECAHQQGLFWEYKQALFDHPDGLGNAELLALATVVGLDTVLFNSCLRHDEARAAVERDILDAWERGVTGTPTFFINGRRFQGARSLDELTAYIRLAALEAG